MAEINIERKKKPTWIWIILLLVVIALVAWALYELTDDDNEVEVDEAPTTGMVLPAEELPPLVYTAVA
ncbi:hypothetical protein POKO110462_17740 [Pontibacter korlensis]|uniref:Uncharacterized protein n=1 Tax=Pontibacter korlensis TaxID=400092 RepID=A0A0E3ZJ70_9BACT|nr:hypothetical protein [Pontibacter korlensis]AKD05039.1 hypothetical protein PKOR_20650 [Pontibacter korlensis]